MALVCAGTVRAQVCPGDFNGDQVVTVNEILVSVRYALYGCPGPGPRLVDNGDGTVTDNETGLMWEQKTDDGGIHDATNRYSWSNGEPWQPVGTAFATFVATLNDCTSRDGKTVTGGFAGYCDWRLPTVTELATIVAPAAPGCGTGAACIDPIFGPTANAVYWSSTTNALNATNALGERFDSGGPVNDIKTDDLHVRAVRGGLCVENGVCP
jgi:hypothetical protein